MKGHQRTIKLVGVGYKVNVAGNKILLKIGFSNTIEIIIPKEIIVTQQSPTKIILSSVDLHKLTLFAALIRSKRKPEPYNGKGIFVEDEIVIRKSSKKK